MLSKGPGPDVLEAIEHLSTDGFEERCVHADIRKTAIESLEEQEPEWLIFDFADERFELLLCDDVILTLSDGLSNSKLLKHKAFARAVICPRFHPLTTKLWSESLGKLRKRMASSALAQARIVLHRCYFATEYQDDGGDPARYAHTGFPHGSVAVDEVRQMNRLLSIYHMLFLKAFPEAVVIEAPKETRIAAPDHKWGPNAMHYIPAYYEALAASARSVGLQIEPARASERRSVAGI